MSDGVKVLGLLAAVGLIGWGLYECAVIVIGHLLAKAAGY